MRMCPDGRPICYARLLTSGELHDAIAPDERVLPGHGLRLIWT
jgi:hypothetical protein